MSKKQMKVNNIQETTKQVFTKTMHMHQHQKVTEMEMEKLMIKIN